MYALHQTKFLRHCAGLMLCVKLRIYFATAATQFIVQPGNKHHCISKIEKKNNNIYTLYKTGMNQLIDSHQTGS